MDQPLYDHELDAVPPPRGANIPIASEPSLKSSAKGESVAEQAAGTFESWVTSLNLGALIGYSLIAALTIVSPFLLLSSQTRVIGAVLLVALMFTGLLFLGLRKDTLLVRSPKGGKDQELTQPRTSIQIFARGCLKTTCCGIYLLATTATIFAMDAVFIGSVLETQEKVSGLYILLPMIAAVISICALASIAGWRNSVAFGILAAFWLAVFQFPIAMMGSMILIKLGLVTAKFAAGVATASFVLALPMIALPGMIYNWAEAVMKNSNGHPASSI